MCSFLFTNKEINNDNIQEVNYYQKFRGPDYTSIFRAKGFTFIHNLLSITGEFTTQPFVDKNIVCMYNGEIYNYDEFGNYDSDGCCLIPLYKKFGKKFVYKLDGEFALILVDFNKREIIISTDTFRTKPIFIGFDNKDNFGIASYESALKGLGLNNIQMVKPNTTLILDLDTFFEIDKQIVRYFDISQYKKTYDDWIKAFENSIKKRTRTLTVDAFYGLSSGYDSGAIGCELNKLDNINVKAFSIVGPENKRILKERQKQLDDFVWIELTKKEYKQARKIMKKIGEEFYYKDKYKNYNYKNDKATYGLANICQRGRKDGYIVYFSGQGSDEIISDYGFGGKKIYNHSSFGGQFPKDLKQIFPWHSFFDGTQIQYLNKEEYTAGAFGIETRYPFLDPFLVQEYLWLDVDLKNKYYKAPLREYFIRNNFPFDENRKIGFNVKKGLK